MKPLGQETITLFNGSDIVADAFRWKFLLAEYTAYTMGTELLRWNVNVNAQNYTNDYVNFTVIPDTQRAAFQSTFAVPKQCQGSQVPRCDSAVSTKFLKFLRGGQSMPTTRTAKVQDTCTRPHESCCPAPLNDPKNCPASARTSDCDAKKSCCCG